MSYKCVKCNDTGIIPFANGLAQCECQPKCKFCNMHHIGHNLSDRCRCPIFDEDGIISGYAQTTFTPQS